MKSFSRPHICNLLGEFWYSEQIAHFTTSDTSSVKDIVGHGILICGFSPDFFKRKAWTRHLLCVVCQPDCCPSPRAVPLFANMETRLPGLGESGECSELVPPPLAPPGCGHRPRARRPGQNGCLGGGRTEAGTPPCSVGFRVFQFYFRFLFLFFFLFFFFFSHFPFNPLA